MATAQVGVYLDPTADHRRVHRVVVVVEPDIVVAGQPQGLGPADLRGHGLQWQHRLAVRGNPVVGAYLLTVEFSSHAVAMENSDRPETGEFAAFLNSICDEPLGFRNLDVLRTEDV